MPIKGTTDRDSIKPRFPRLGKLRKGDKKTGRGPGQDLTYFRFTSDDERVVAAFKDAYGAQPDRLEVYLPYKTPDENFDTWMEEWAAGGLVHRCDGVTCTIWQQEDGSYAYDAVPCPYASGKKTRGQKKPGCVEVGRLSVVLPDLLQAGHVGYVVMETHSNHDLRNIMAVLLAVEESRPEGLQGIPFTLHRYKEKISTPSGENGQRARREKSLVALVPSPTWVESRMLLARAEAFAALPSGESLVDDVPVDELGSDDEADIEAELSELHADLEAEIIELFPDDEADEVLEGEVEPIYDMAWAITVNTGEKVPQDIPASTEFGELNADQLMLIFEKSENEDRKRAASMLLDKMEETAVLEADPDPVPSADVDPLDEFVEDTDAEVKDLDPETDAVQMEM